MIIYKDVFTEDELCSDSFPMKLVDNLIYEFKGKHVVRKEGDVVLDGANPSAEGEDGEDGGDEHVERGIDFVLNHRLQEMNCYEDAATFKSYIKNYMKKVVEYMEKNGKSADVDSFKKKIQAWVAIVEFREESDGEHPYLMLIAAGIIDEKA
ncbi:translationally controlled tumor protein [Ditylenchus destructor]|nr:translationally controlled tumor protein [Ditylenchus destructor]